MSEQISMQGVFESIKGDTSLYGMDGNRKRSELARSVLNGLGRSNAPVAETTNEKAVASLSNSFFWATKENIEKFRDCVLAVVNLLNKGEEDVLEAISQNISMIQDETSASVGDTLDEQERLLSSQDCLSNISRHIVLVKRTFCIEYKGVKFMHNSETNASYIFSSGDERRDKDFTEEDQKFIESLVLLVKSGSDEITVSGIMENSLHYIFDKDKGMWKLPNARECMDLIVEKVDHQNDDIVIEWKGHELKYCPDEGTFELTLSSDNAGTGIINFSKLTEDHISVFQTITAKVLSGAGDISVFRGVSCTGQTSLSYSKKSEKWEDENGSGGDKMESSEEESLEQKALKIVRGILDRFVKPLSDTKGVLISSEEDPEGKYFAYINGNWGLTFGKNTYSSNSDSVRMTFKMYEFFQEIEKEMKKPSGKFVVVGGDWTPFEFNEDEGKWQSIYDEVGVVDGMLWHDTAKNIQVHNDHGGEKRKSIIDAFYRFAEYKGWLPNKNEGSESDVITITDTDVTDYCDYTLQVMKSGRGESYAFSLVPYHDGDTKRGGAIFQEFFDSLPK